MEIGISIADKTCCVGFSETGWSISCNFNNITPFHYIWWSSCLQSLEWSWATVVCFWDLLRLRPSRVAPQDRPIGMRVVGEDAWLAAWQHRPQPPHSLWRPPFTSVHTIFMQERDFPSENKPRLKRKQLPLPNKFLLICQRRRGRRGATQVMDACPSRCRICLSVCVCKCVCVCVSLCYYMSKGCQLFHQLQLWHIPDASCSGVSLVKRPTSPSSKCLQCPSWSKMNVFLCCFPHLI